MSDTQITLEFLANTDGLKAAAQQMQLLGKLSKEQYNQFTKAGAEYQKQLKENAKLQQAWGETITESTDQATLLNSQFRTLGNIVAQGALQQAVGRFTQLANQAANATNAIKDTGKQIEYLDTDGSFASLLDSARDVVSVFTLAKNTTALFGNENKELANAIAKASEAIDLVNDAQKVANNLIKEGGVLAKAYNFTLAIAETLQTQFAISSTAAWAAATGGITLVVGAIGAMVYAITEATGQSVEGIKMLTKELDKAYESYNARTENINQNSSEIQSGLQKELLALYEKKATLKEVQAVENEIAAERLRALKEQKGALVNTSAPLETLVTQYKALFYIYDSSKSANRSKEEIEALKAQLDGVGKLIDEHRKLDLAIAKFKQDEKIRKKQQATDTLNNERTVLEQELLLNKKYSETGEKLQLEILKKERDIKLNALTITNEQAKLINLQFNRDKLLLEQQYDIAALNQAKQTIDTKLAKQREGTRQEFELRIQAIQAAADIEKRAVTENTIYTQQQRANIQAKANADIQKLSREFNFAMAQSQIEADQAYQQTRSINAKANSKELLDAELALIDAQADAKRLAIDKDVVNETEHKNKLLLLDAETNQQKLAKQQEYYNQLKTIRQQDIDNSASHAKTLAQLQLGNAGQGPKAEFELKIKQYDIEATRLNQQLQNVQDIYKKEVAEYEKLNKDKTELDRTYAAERQAIEDEIATNTQAKDNEVYQQRKEHLQKQLEMESQLVSLAVNTIIELRKTQIEQEYSGKIGKLEQARDKELQNENLTSEQKKIIQSNYAQQIGDLKRRQFEQEKKLKLAEIATNTVLAISKLSASTPPAINGIPNPAYYTALAMLIAQGVAQAALVATTSFPAYQKGGKNIPAGMKLVGEQGPELIWTPGGETIIPHGDTAKILEAWSIPVPSVNPAIKTDMAIAAVLPAGINYNKLAAVLAQELRNNPSINISMDSAGFAMHLLQKNKSVQLLNNRYSA